jgi:hypothetical protein
MNTSRLFAIDAEKEEVNVSESPKGSNQIKLLERVKKSENEMLFKAVETLTCITKDNNFDAAIFKAMDKVCQMIYEKHKESK